MLLLKVEEARVFADKGIFVLPRIVDYIVEEDTLVKLVRPDKTEIIVNLPYFNNGLIILGDKNLTKEDVPIGTEVWLIT